MDSKSFSFGSITGLISGMLSILSFVLGVKYAELNQFKNPPTIEESDRVIEIVEMYREKLMNNPNYAAIAAAERQRRAQFSKLLGSNRNIVMNLGEE
jgi:hypothetical protein